MMTTIRSCFFMGLVYFLLGQSYLLIAQLGERTLLPVSDGVNWGFADRSGKIVIPSHFVYARDFHDGAAVVGTRRDPLSNKVLSFGFIGFDGNLLPTKEFDFASRFSEGLAAVRLSGAEGTAKFGYIDHTGTLTIPSRFTKAGDFSEGLAAVGTVDGDVFIDRTGVIVIPATFADTKPFSGGLAAVRFKDRKYSFGQYSFIDRQGKVIYNPADDKASKLNCHRFSEGLAPVTRGGKVGFINSSGEVTIDFKYDDAGCFSNALAWALQGDKYGFIDTRGSWVVEPQFIKAKDFVEGLAPVQQIVEGEPLWSYIDVHGREEVPAMFVDAQSFSSGAAEIRDAVYGLGGYINRQGKIVARSSYPVPRDAGGTPGLRPLLGMKLRTTPNGAVVYLVPLRTFETHPGIYLNDNDLGNYRYANGNTDVICDKCVYEKKYWAIFTLQQLRCKLLIDIRSDSKNDFYLSLRNGEPACKR